MGMKRMALITHSIFFIFCCTRIASGNNGSVQTESVCEKLISKNLEEKREILLDSFHILVELPYVLRPIYKTITYQTIFSPNIPVRAPPVEA